MLTEILIQEAGQVIDYDIKTINQERGEIKKMMSQVDYSTNKANPIKHFEKDYLGNQRLQEKSSSKQHRMSKKRRQPVTPTWIRSEMTQLLESTTSLVKIHYLHPGLEPEKTLMSLLYMKVSYNHLLRKLETN